MLIVTDGWLGAAPAKPRLVGRGSHQAVYEGRPEFSQGPLCRSFALQSFVSRDALNLNSEVRRILLILVVVHVIELLGSRVGKRSDVSAIIVFCHRDAERFTHSRLLSPSRFWQNSFTRIEQAPN